MIRTTPTPATLPLAEPPSAIPRAEMTDGKDIRAAMLADLMAEPAMADPEAVITRYFFLCRGWTPAQVEMHAGAAVGRFGEALAARQAT